MASFVSFFSTLLPTIHIYACCDVRCGLRYDERVAAAAVIAEILLKGGYFSLHNNNNNTLKAFQGKQIIFVYRFFFYTLPQMAAQEYYAFISFLMIDWFLFYLAAAAAVVAAVTGTMIVFVKRKEISTFTHRINVFKIIIIVRKEKNEKERSFFASLSDWPPVPSFKSFFFQCAATLSADFFHIPKKKIQIDMWNVWDCVWEGEKWMRAARKEDFFSITHFNFHYFIRFNKFPLSPNSFPTHKLDKNTLCHFKSIPSMM